MDRAVTDRALKSLEENRKKAIEKIRMGSEKLDSEKHSIYLTDNQLNFIKNFSSIDSPRNQLISRGIEELAELLRNNGWGWENVLKYYEQSKIPILKPNKNWVSKKFSIKTENYILFSSLGEELKKRKRIKTKFPFSLGIRSSIDYYRNFNF